ncbi:MAG: HEAT repeat domain-containing protein [Gemmataceae bacterium]|nr:HEAT repeat domain-containing protein [Gemmataceae bacterium]
MRKCVLVAAGLALLLSLPAAGQPDRTSVTGLVWALDAPRPAERLKAAEQLGFYGTAAKASVRPLMVLMRDDPDTAVANMAAVSLARIGPAALPALIKGLQDGRQPVRQRAAWALSKFGPEGKQAVPELLVALKDQSARVRALAAEALGEIGAEPHTTVPALFRSLRDGVPEVRRQAGLALLNLGAVTVEPFQEVLADADAQVRQDALWALGMLGREAKEAVPHVTPLLKDQDAEVRAAAAAALASMGPEGARALPALLAALKDERHLGAQQTVLWAINLIGTQDTPGLMKAVREINDQGRWAGVLVVEQFGPRPADAVAPLGRLLGDGQDGNRLAAALALGEIGADAKPAVPQLLKALQDRNAAVRAAAAAALARLDPSKEVMAGKQFDSALARLDGIFLNARAELDRARERLEQKLRQDNLTALQQLFRPVNRQALTDPLVQKHFNQIVDLHIFLSTYRPSSDLYRPGANNDERSRLRTLVSDALSKLPPEAMPALVRGFNQALKIPVGFS